MSGLINVVARYITGGNRKTAQLFVLFLVVVVMLIAWNWALMVNKESQLYVGPEHVQVPINQL